MMNRTRILTVVAAVALFAFVVLVGIGYVSLSFGLPKAEVSKKIKDLYELANPGTTAEVISMSGEDGLYKAVIKLTGAGGTNYAEVYATKDGKLLTLNIIFVEEATGQIKRLKDFVDCLDSKGVRIYGLNNQTATLLQLNILGIYSTKLYVSCDEELVQNCIAAKVTQVPSVVFSTGIEPGIKTIQWFEQAIGCKY